MAALCSLRGTGSEGGPSGVVQLLCERGRAAWRSLAAAPRRTRVRASRVPAAAAEGDALPAGWVQPGERRTPVKRSPYPGGTPAPLRSGEALLENDQALRTVDNRAQALGGGRPELIDAYASILGRHAALAACASNEKMLETPTSPQQVLGCFEALSGLVGATEARELCLREPSVLYQKPSCVADCCAALEAAVGTEAAVFALSRNPTLLQPGRDTHFKGALDALTFCLEDPALARQLAQRNTLLLGTPVSTLVGSFEELAALFGGAAVARSMAVKHPGLLRSLPRTLRGAWAELLRIWPEPQDALYMMQRNTAVLKARPVTIRESWATLVDIFGEEPAHAVVASQLGLLRSRAVTLRASHGAIVSCLGANRSPEVLANTPVLLQIRTRVLWYNWNHYVAFLGADKARELACAVPHVLAARIGRAAAQTDAMQRILGTPEACAAIVPHPVWRKSGADISARFLEIVRQCGGDEDAARKACVADARVLTCSENVVLKRYLRPEEELLGV